MTPNENTGRKKRITVITPVYMEEASLSIYANAVEEILFVNTEYDIQVLFVDDGSRDRSWKIIEELCNRNSRFKGLRLSRNFGPHIALCAGFEAADGDAIATLACDLQDPPETILKFLEKWKEGANIVWGRRLSRKDGILRSIATHVFMRILRAYAMPADSQFSTGSFFLIDQKIKDCLIRFQEQNRITFALVAWTGFNQSVVEYYRAERKAGRSGWTLTKLLKAMYDTFLGFSTIPLRVMKLISMFAFILASALTLLVCYWYWKGVKVEGWTSTMLTISIFFSLQFFIMSVVGEYLYRIYIEVVRRPLYLISPKTGQWPDEKH